MDAVEFLNKWNKICAYMVDVNDMSCRNCELDDICGKLCSKPGEVTKEECEEFVKKVNEIYEENNKNKLKKCCVTCANFLDKQMGFGLYCNVCNDYSQWIESKEDQNESNELDPSRTCRNCKYAGILVNLEPCFSCSSSIRHKSWEPKEDQNE